MASPQIKGAAVRALLDWYRRTNGSAAYAALFSQLSPEERAMLGAKSNEVLPSAWYDARLAHRLLEVVFGTLPIEQHPVVAREAAREGLRILRKGVYQYVATQIATPAFYARHIQRLFRLLHDNGDRRIELSGKSEALSITENWAGHHPLMCMMVNETMAAVLEALGCQDVTVEPIACVSNGARDCRCTVRWRSS